MNKINYRCPICWTNEINYKFHWFDYCYNNKNKSYDVVQCKNCWLEQIYPIPKKEEQLLFYPDNYYSKHLKEEKKSLIDKCSKIEWIFFNIFNNKKFGLPKEIWNWKYFLDIGCWDWKNIEIMKWRWWNAEWFEIWNNNKYINDIYYSDSIVNVNFGKKYDVIFCNHVFEHVDNPLEFLEKVNLILKDEWFFILNLPNVSNISSLVLWKYASDRDIPRHLYWYNYNNIQILLKKCWFKILYKHKWRQQGTAASIARRLIWKYWKDIRGSVLYILVWILCIPLEFILSLTKNTNTMWFVLKKS